MLAQVLVHIRLEREERRGILTQGTGALAGLGKQEGDFTSSRKTNINNVSCGKAQICLHCRLDILK